MATALTFRFPPSTPSPSSSRAGTGPASPGSSNKPLRSCRRACASGSSRTGLATSAPHDYTGR